MTKFILLYSILINLFILGQTKHYWTWSCTEEHRCLKQRAQPNKDVMTLEICELLCYQYSRIWPMPTGSFKIKKQLATIDLDQNYATNGPDSKILQLMVNRFHKVIESYNDFPTLRRPKTTKTKINFNITDYENVKLDLEIDESYTLFVNVVNSNLEIQIVAKTLFGARNALESLSQIIVFDTVSKSYVIPSMVTVIDGPKYPIRGLMIDTARNYISVHKIKKVIEGMAVNKLNTLHWHITDAQSFPFVSESLPELSELGAYSQRKVYSFAIIKELINWALIRGVRIIPEFDAPAHVGEGWQDTDLVVCFDKQPWGSYCKEPPCGQFDVTKEELYTILPVLYKDLIAAFDPEVFHFGGDEVVFNCWRSVESIRNWMIEHNMSWIWDSGHVEMWSMFQNRSYSLFMKERQREIPSIIWTSTLTDSKYLHNLPNDKYIIQIWTKAKDSTIKDLLANNYKVILSNYDALYLDCGFNAWIGQNGLNWCAPYSTWMKVYENSPLKIVQGFGEETNKPHLIMGSIAPLWSETVDDSSLENRFWPRGAALAERIWAEPSTGWSMAENRMESQRQRMVKLGIDADTLVPQWCHMNQESCH